MCTFSYQNLLETHNELTVHQRNLQVLMMEIYEIFNDVTWPIMNSFFEFRSNLCNIINFQVNSTVFRRTANYGIEAIIYRAPSLWAKLPSEYKLLLKNSKWKLRNGNVTHTSVAYPKNFNQFLGLLIRNMFKNMSICFVFLQFYKKIRNLIPK